MRFTQHPSNNLVLGAPPQWPHGKAECGALPVTQRETAAGQAMVSYWEPSADDLRKLAAGGKIRLWIFGPMHPPVSLDVEGE